MSMIFWTAVGMIIGWNLPQPEWAQKVQNSVIDFVKNIF